MTAISLRNISKAYGEHPPVLRDVNLDIAEHEFCVFLGHRAVENRRCCV